MDSGEYIKACASLWALGSFKCCSSTWYLNGSVRWECELRRLSRAILSRAKSDSFPDMKWGKAGLGSPYEVAISSSIRSVPGAAMEPGGGVVTCCSTGCMVE